MDVVHKLWATSALPACMAKCGAVTPKAPGKNWDGRGTAGRAGHSCTSSDPTGTELTSMCQSINTRRYQWEGMMTKGCCGNLTEGAYF